MTHPAACDVKHPQHHIWWDCECPFRFDYIDGTWWRLVFSFKFSYDTLEANIERVIPDGFLTDFHSVPRCLWWLVHPFHYGQAAVIHDYLYRLGSGASRKLADMIYAAALERCGCPAWRIWGMYAALRLCGWWSFGREEIV